MALRGSGFTTLTFADDSQAAQYVTSTVVTDSVPNPNVLGWQTRTLPVSASWRAVAFGNGVYVAVASGGTIAVTSPDAVTWTQRTLPTSTTWNAVGYGDGLFVALASGGTIAATSPDGITWTQQTLPVSNTWSQVAYGNGIFVAIGNTTIAATSPDGVTWTQQTVVTATSGAGLAYGNGLFVASANNNVVTSNDGVTWTQQATGSPVTTNNVAYGGGVFVVLEGGNNITLVSNNGINWTFTNNIISQWQKVVFGNNIFLCLNFPIGRISTSVNTGTNIAWAQEIKAVTTWRHMAFGDSGFVVFEGSGNTIYTSADGYTTGVPLANTRTTTTVNTQIVPAYPVVGSNTATVAVTGLTDMTAGGSASAFLMASDSTATHNDYEHGLVPVTLRCADFVAGIGFTIYASSRLRLDKSFKIRYAWSA